MRRPLHAAPAALLLLLLAGTARADDPLDRVTGTEGWRVAGPQDTGTELKDWYRARVQLRQGQQELRLQRARSGQLAVLLRKFQGRRPDMRQVRRVLRSKLVKRRKKRTKRRPRTRTRAKGRVGKGGAFLLPGEAGPGEEELAEEAPGDGDTPEPPGWVKVPVERLDSRGQAIDEEGDRELQRSLKK